MNIRDEFLTTPDSPCTSARPLLSPHPQTRPDKA